MTARSRQSIDEFVQSWLRTVDSVRHPVEADSMLIEIGLDSLDVVELSRSLRQAGINVRPTDIDSYDTLTETITKIHELAQAG
ncbi:phosphopantetheine-binding protein [Amycolatopsis magusensis]|uniref:phosphopantetheine-binding protein n=1 Tax=Amycolatopsis magusensis TaxID=882444 RepID=UPI003C2D44F3